MDLLIYPLAFLLLLGVIVTIHELGHYVVARWSGVHIVRFSIGFGKPFWSRFDKRGTEWALAPIPLGGYLRMLDEHEPMMPNAPEMPEGAEVTSHADLHPGWRIAIAFGGPLANLILAVVVYWGLSVAGSLSYAPMHSTAAVAQAQTTAVSVDAAETRSPLYLAGLEAPARIIAIDDQPIDSWQSAGLALTDRLGETGTVAVTARDLATNKVNTYAVPIIDWLQDRGDPNVLEELGFVPAVLSIVGQVEEGSPAQQAGLREGDWVTSVDGRPVASWSAWVTEIEAAADRDVVMTLQRDGRTLDVRVRPGSRVTETGETVGRLGVGPSLIEVSRGPLEAMPLAVAETWDNTVMILTIVKKMIFGQVSVDNLSGPISIAQVAGDSAKYSLRSFIGILAFLSVSIGVFNMLPIPILDGGNIMFNTAELITGKPVSERVQVFGVQIGLLLVGTLMIFATYRDILRVF